MSNFGIRDTTYVALIAALAYVGIILDFPFMTIFVLGMGAIALVSRGLLVALKHSYASEPLEARMGTITARGNSSDQLTHYDIRFVDNGETRTIMTFEGEGPMCLSPGEYGLLSVRGRILYAFEPKKK